MESNDKQTGFTYFIQEGYDNFFKIGHTYGDVEKRKNDLQTGNSTELRVFGKIETAEPERLENELKKLFTNEHQRGEWFCIDPSDAVDIIKEKNGVVCVEDPLKVRISFDKESYRKQVIQEVAAEIRKELDAEYKKKIKGLNDSSFKWSNIGFAIVEILGGIIVFVKKLMIAAIIIAGAWIAFSLLQKLVQEADADAKRLVRKRIEMDSISTANLEKSEKGLKKFYLEEFESAANELDSINALVWQGKKVSSADRFFAEQSYLIASKSYFNFTGRSRNNFYKKTENELEFDKYESFLDDSAMCVSMMSIYENFKKNSGKSRDFEICNGQQGLDNQKIKLNKLKQAIHEMDKNYPEFWLRSKYH